MFLEGSLFLSYLCMCVFPYYRIKINFVLRKHRGEVGNCLLKTEKWDRLHVARRAETFGKIHSGPMSECRVEMDGKILGFLPTRFLYSYSHGKEPRRQTPNHSVLRSSGNQTWIKATSVLVSPPSIPIANVWQIRCSPSCPNHPARVFLTTSGLRNRAETYCVCNAGSGTGWLLSKLSNFPRLSLSPCPWLLATGSAWLWTPRVLNTGCDWLIILLGNLGVYSFLAYIIHLSNNSLKLGCFRSWSWLEAHCPHL